MTTGCCGTADKNHGEPQRISPKTLFAENRLNQVRDPDTSDGHPRVMLDGEDAFAELDVNRPGFLRELVN